MLSDTVKELENWKGSVKDTLIEITNNNKKSQSAQIDKIASMNAKIDNIENILGKIVKAQNSTEIKNESRIRNPWMIIATGVIGFTQIVILAVIYNQFIA